MAGLSAKHGKYIYLIAFISILIFGYNSVDAINCVQCGGSLAKCGESEQPKQCPDANTTQCFTLIDGNGGIERGCRKNGEEDSCKIDAKNNCVLTGDSGNKQLVCKKCDGSDSKCSQTDMSSNDIANHQICDASAKNCYMKVENKLVFRGCQTNDNSTQCTNTDQNTCKTCTTDNCNTGIFPADRIKCYQCSGSNCQNVTDDLSQTCQNYAEKDECYIKSESEGSTRGCKSDTKDNKCQPSVQGCTFCNTTNCNNEPYEFTCIVCRSDIDKKCWNNADQFPGQNCRTGNSSAKEGCFFGIWYGNAIRGCLIDASPQTQAVCEDKENNQCIICHEKNCNTKKSLGVKNSLSYGLMLTVLIALWQFK